MKGLYDHLFPKKVEVKAEKKTNSAPKKGKTPKHGTIWRDIKHNELYIAAITDAQVNIKLIGFDGVRFSDNGIFDDSEEYKFEYVGTVKYPWGFFNIIEDCGSEGCSSTVNINFKIEYEEECRRYDEE